MIGSKVNTTNYEANMAIEAEINESARKSKLEAYKPKTANNYLEQIYVN